MFDDALHHHPPPALPLFQLHIFCVKELLPSSPKPISAAHICTEILCFGFPSQNFSYMAHTFNPSTLGRQGSVSLRPDWSTESSRTAKTITGKPFLEKLKNNQKGKNKNQIERQAWYLLRKWDSATQDEQR